MTKQELFAMMLEREQLAMDAQNYFNAHADKSGQLPKVQASAYSGMGKTIDKMSAEIQSAFISPAMQAELRKPTTEPIREPIRADYFSDSNSGGQQMTGITGQEYTKNFFNAVRANFRDAVKNSYLQVGEPSQGGYLVPEEMDREIVRKLQDVNVIRQLARIITTQSNHRIPIVASSPTASWIKEGAPIQFTDGTFTQLNLDAFKIAAATKVSNELLADSFYDVSAFLIDEFSKSVGAAEETAFVTGKREDGQPTGFLTTLETVDGATITTKAKGEVTADDLINLIYSLRRPYRRAAKFLCADSMLANIRKLKDADQRFIWEPSLQESEPPRIFGTPVFTSAAMPADIIAYGDFTYYVIGERGGRTIKALHELFAAEDLSAFMLIQRVDGLLTDTDAIRLLKLKA